MRPGDSVASGDALIVIEAAGGRAAVESPAAGIVASVAVIAGDAVAQQQLVATIEPLPA